MKINQLDIFTQAIGQERFKKMIRRRLTSYQETSFMPNLFIGGSSGDGKTYLARLLAKAMHEIDKEKKRDSGLTLADGDIHYGKGYRKVNCGIIKNARDLFEGIILPDVEGKRVTVHFDECHDLPPKVVGNLLSILEPTPKRFNVVKYDDYSFEFDFRKVTFIFTTTEEQNVFPPLMDRLQKVALEVYSPEELGEIVQLACPKTKISAKVLKDMVDHVRWNGRGAHKLGDEIRTLEISNVTENSWKEVKSDFDLLPKGLTRDEVAYLRILGENPDGLKITTLANRLNKARPTVQNMERYLVQAKLITVDSNRHLTKGGQAYITKV